MKPESLRAFAQLCEAVMLFEASTAMTLLKGYPGAEQVVRLLHRGYQLPDDQKFEEIPVADITKTLRGQPRNWLLVAGPGGVAAGVTSSDRNGVRIVVWHNNDVEQDEVMTFRNFEEVAKNSLGGIDRAWLGTMSQESGSKRHQRLMRQVPEDVDDMMVYIANRFRPLWLRLIRSAMVDLKGVIQTLVRHDSHDRAAQKLEHLRTLHDLYHDIETNSTTNIAWHGHTQDMLRAAIRLTAQHMFPEATRGGRTSIRPVFDEIRKGNLQVLGTVIAYFKRTLLHPRAY